jgi:hypothetical protein
MSDSNNNLVESQHILVCKCCGAPQLYQICSVALNAVTSGLYSLCTFEEKNRFYPKHGMCADCTLSHYRRSQELEQDDGHALSQLYMHPIAKTMTIKATKNAATARTHSHSAKLAYRGRLVLELWKRYHNPDQ